MSEDTWEPLADIVGRLVDELTDVVFTQRAQRTTAKAEGLAGALKSEVRAGGSLELDAGLAVAPGGWESAAIGEWGKKPGNRSRPAVYFRGETDRLAKGGELVNLPIRERRTAPNGIAAGSS